MDTDGICCLPNDLLLDILRRLPGRALAVSRCVCRAWRDLVRAQTHTLLLPQVFPREFPGVFAHYHGFDPNFALFGPPASGSDAREPGYRRPFWNHWHCVVKHHSNGLLLVTAKCWPKFDMNLYMCNPATSRYARLPCPPTPWPCNVEGLCLAFDPAVSPHHEVFFLPREKLQQPKEEPHESCWMDWLHTFGEVQPSELPAEMPKVFHVFVFSSETGKWGTRVFTPGRCASGQLYDVVTAPRRKDQQMWWSAEYWHGSLYMHCHSGVVVVLRCLERTYDLVRLPGIALFGDESVYQWTLPTRYLGSYNRGIRYAVIRDLCLEVWDLVELADDQLGWTLAHNADLKEHDQMINYLRNRPMMQPRKTWAVVENSEKINVDCDDETGDGEDEGNYHKAEDEDDEQQDNDDEDEAPCEEKDEPDIYNDDEDEAPCEEKDEPDIYNDDDDDDDDDKEEEEEEEEDVESTDGSDYSWNSDEHNFIDFDNTRILGNDDWGRGCNIVGFHPYKDVLLVKFTDTLVAYHLHTSRMQYLGYIYPQKHHQQAREVDGAFPYRPCYVDAILPRTTSQ